MNPVAREAQARAQRDAGYYERMGCKVLMSEGVALQLGVTASPAPRELTLEQYRMDRLTTNPGMGGVISAGANAGYEAKSRPSRARRSTTDLRHRYGKKYAGET